MGLTYASGRSKMSTFNATIVSTIVSAATAEKNAIVAATAATDAAIGRALDVVAALCAATAKRDKLDWADAVACVTGKSARTNMVRSDVTDLMAAAGEAAGWRPTTCRQMAAVFFACLGARENFTRGFLANRPRKPRPPADRAVAAAVAMINALNEGGTPPEKIKALIKALRAVGVEVEYTP